ncbi:inverted formin-2-like [Pyrus x bretschneideri]|uniref:inverted formin-2-like n=1 Tax=Pyrus x bretschneideri TaxID=225117 RepID=UPI00202E6C73|nr:inverted formin-2-like [Pyrus x bretschneideri]
MGKSEANLQEQQQQQQQEQQRQIQEAQNSSGLICLRCSVVFSRIGRELSFRCVVVLILSFSILLSGIIWIPHFHAIISQFDARQEIKLSATVQAYFRLEKPVTDLVPHIQRLEYDINAEIGVPGAKVAILSMHQFDASDQTDVVFGALSDPINVPIDPVFLSVLKSSLVELFLKQSNLTLTASIFGEPSMFEILKCPGGITVIPVQSASIWQKPQILFNFTLNNSISDIVENFVELKEQLKFGLHLRPYEDVFLRIINKIGSTEAPPVVVLASLVSDVGIIAPQRLKQLVQTIRGSRAKNLGLNNTVFGKVKSISLSSCPKGAPSATPPTPSPAPSSEPSISPYPASPVPSPGIHHLPPAPALSPDIHHLPPAPLPDINPLPPAPSPDIHHLPLAPSPGTHLLAPAPSPDVHHLPPAPSPEIYHLSPTPSKAPAHPRPCPYHGSRIPPVSSPTSRSNPTAPPTYDTNGSPYSPSPSPSSHFSSHVPAAPVAPYASSPGNKGSAQDSISPSPSSSSSAGAFYKEIWLLKFSVLVIFHLLCWFG